MPPGQDALDEPDDIHAAGRHVDSAAQRPDVHAGAGSAAVPVRVGQLIGQGPGHGGQIDA